MGYPYPCFAYVLFAGPNESEKALQLASDCWSMHRRRLVPGVPALYMHGIRNMIVCSTPGRPVVLLHPFCAPPAEIDGK